MSKKKLTKEELDQIKILNADKVYTKWEFKLTTKTDKKKETRSVMVGLKIPIIPQ